jgi:hypothetical protein
MFLSVLANLWICFPAPAAEPSPDPPRFTHPGLLNSRAELDFVKSKIKSGAEPWRTLFQNMRMSKYGNAGWVPRPVPVVDARSRDAGNEQEDAIAAYTQALLWYFTDDETYARNSVAILNAWSAMLVRHTSTDRQEELVAAWGGSVFPLAGEILRSSYPQWRREEISRFSVMLNNGFLPVLVSGNPKYNGNWELAMINALLCIGVFNDAPATFARGIQLWRNRVPAYFYLAADGNAPRRPFGTSDLDTQSAIENYWFHPRRYVDGLCQETLRDNGHHMQEGLASAVNSAEIALHQGVDLYSEDEDRLVAAMELHATLLLGRPVSADVFPDGFVAAGWLPTWEVAYNHFHNRRGLSLPETGALINLKVRPSHFAPTHLNMVWESLTHAELESAAKTPLKKTANQPQEP